MPTSYSKFKIEDLEALNIKVRQWQFIRYSNGFAEVDSTVYYINQLPQILGILQHIVNTQKKYWI